MPHKVVYSQHFKQNIYIREPLKKPRNFGFVPKRGGGLAQSETLILIWSVKTQCWLGLQIKKMNRFLGGSEHVSVLKIPK